MLQAGIILIMGATLYSRFKHPVLTTPDGGTKKRMNPALYWTFMAIGLLLVVGISLG
jgi:hypothetical protein